MKKQMLIVSCIVFILALVVLGCYFIKKTSMQRIQSLGDKSLETEDNLSMNVETEQPDVIKTGKVAIDYNKVAELQKSVDSGSQSWRLDINMVATAELPQYGFTLQDIKNLQCPFVSSNWVIGKDLTGLSCEVPHNGQKYEIEVSQPEPGVGKIFMVSEIEPE